jgi:hypothetical protein
MLAPVLSKISTKLFRNNDLGRNRETSVTYDEVPLISKKTLILDGFLKAAQLESRQRVTAV